jgi:hypothetical protein
VRSCVSRLAAIRNLGPLLAHGGAAAVAQAIVRAAHRRVAAWLAGRDRDPFAAPSGERIQPDELPRRDQASLGFLRPAKITLARLRPATLARPPVRSGKLRL